MKNFFKKLKKCSKLSKYSYILLNIIYLVCLVFFLINIIQYKKVETALRVIISLIFIIWLIIYFFTSALCLFTKRKKTFTTLSIITTIFIVFLAIGSFALNYIYDSLSGFNNKNYLDYTTNLVTLKETKFDENSQIGMINNSEDIEGFQLAKKLISKENLNNDIKEYEDYYEMIADLYDKKIDAIFLSGNYKIIYSSEEAYKNIATETTVIFEFSEKLKNNDYELKSEKKLTEPFTILLMGVDSEKDGLNANQAFNGDTLMMITFNPNTLNATMFSIPRDSYVPIACRNNNLAKVNSSAAYGTKCVIDTLKNLTGIDIDYFVKLNFKGVVDLVNSLGGVTVDVEKPYYTYNHGHNCGGRFCEQNSNRQWGENTIYLDPGVQTLNGEQALAYARCRALYIDSDLARNRHQQQIVEASAKKLKSVRNLEDFQSILKSITNNMDTNISTDQMLSFYDVAKSIIFKDNDSDELITIQKTYLEVYDLPVYLPGSQRITSALGYYEPSLEAIKKAMRINLELETEEMPKSYSISYNEEYTEKVIGKGLYGGSIRQTMPSFVGKTITEATNWCSSKKITYHYEYVDSNSPNYNYDVGPGLIANQSVHKGTLLENVSNVTFYINNASIPETPNKPSESEDENVPNDNPIIDIPGGPEENDEKKEENTTENNFEDPLNNLNEE